MWSLDTHTTETKAKQKDRMNVMILTVYFSEAMVFLLWTSERIDSCPWRDSVVFFLLDGFWVDDLTAVCHLMFPCEATIANG